MNNRSLVGDTKGKLKEVKNLGGTDLELLAAFE